MKLTPVASPSQIVQTASTVGISPDARARAIARLVPEAPQTQAPVPVNASNISVEELSAIIPTTSTPDTEEQHVEAPETPAPVEAKDPAISKQFAQLARQERLQRQQKIQQDQAMKAREEAVNQREAKAKEIEERYSKGYVSQEDLKKNALSKLLEAGVSYEELTEQVLRTQNVDPQTQSLLNSMEAKVAALEARLQQQDKNAQQQQVDARSAAIKQITMDATKLVKDDPAFETVKATNSIRDVVELIEQTYDQDGIVLSVEEAAQEVENYLIEEAMKITRIGKIKQRLAQAAQPATPKPNSQTLTAQKSSPAMKTLTNQNSTSRQLSARERAVLAFRGELK